MGRISKIFFVALFIVFLVHFFSCSRYDFSDRFATSPIKPHSGEGIVILYNPVGTKLESKENIMATIRSYGKKDFQQTSFFSRPNNIIDTEEYLMDKEKGGYKAEIHLSDTAAGLLVTFKSKKHVDDGDGLGYWVPLYNSEGLLVSGANAGYAAALVPGGWGSELNMAKFSDTLLTFYEKEFDLYPEKKQDFLFSYLSSMKKSKGSESYKEIEKLLLDFDRGRELLESELFFLSSWYRSIKNKDQSELYKKRALENFPKGKWSQREKLSEFYKLKKLNERVDFLNNFNNEFPSATGLEYMRGVILGQYIEGSQFQEALTYFEKQEPDSFSSYPVFSSIHKNINASSDSLELLDLILGSMIDMSRLELETPTDKKPVASVTSTWMEKKAVALASALDASAYVSLNMDRMDTAKDQLEEAYNLSKGKDKQVNTNYGSILFKTGNLGLARKVLESSIASGFQNPEMEKLIKDIYLKENSSEDGYEDYFSGIKALAMDNLSNKIKEKMISESSFGFTLFDTKGNKVSLSDYRGQAVVLDFWATWCGPCKASFPAMEKAMAKYSDAKFLFINSRESGDEKLKKVANYMSENDYPFHVLMDEDDSVFQSYKIAFLPTKIILDGNGIIRYKSIGFYGEQELLDEFEVLLPMIKI